MVAPAGAFFGYSCWPSSFSHPHRNRPLPATRVCAPPFTVSGAFSFRFPPRGPTRALARPAARVRDGTSIVRHPLDEHVEGRADHTNSSAEQLTCVQLTRMGVWVACDTERASEGLHRRLDRHPPSCTLHVFFCPPPGGAPCVSRRGSCTGALSTHGATLPPIPHGQRPPPQPWVLRLFVARRACRISLSWAGTWRTSPPRPAATISCPNRPAPRGGAHPPSATHNPIPTNVPAA